MYLRPTPRAQRRMRAATTACAVRQSSTALARARVVALGVCVRKTAPPPRSCVFLRASHPAYRRALLPLALLRSTLARSAPRMVRAARTARCVLGMRATRCAAKVAPCAAGIVCRACPCACLLVLRIPPRSAPGLRAACSTTMPTHNGAALRSRSVRDPAAHPGRTVIDPTTLRSAWTVHPWTSVTTVLRPPAHGVWPRRLACPRRTTVLPPRHLSLVTARCALCKTTRFPTSRRLFCARHRQAHAAAPSPRRAPARSCRAAIGANRPRCACPLAAASLASARALRSTTTTIAEHRAPLSASLPCVLSSCLGC